MLKRFWTGKDGEPCVAKLQNSIVWAITVLKLLLGGVTVWGIAFEPVTMEEMTPYLTLLGVTTGGYAIRSHTKAKAVQ